MDETARPQPPYTRAPEGVLDTQRMADGRLLYRRNWRLPAAQRAVLLVHGLGEHSGRYRHVAAWFNARGYDVRGYDQRGHGRSEGARCALSHADDLLTDLTAIYDDYAASAPARPLLLGHSMGGLVAARSVLDGRVAPTAMVLSSPALRSHESAAMQKLATLLARVVPHLPLRTGLAQGGLSHDASVIADYRADPLCSGRITPRMAEFIFRAGPACIADASRLRVPTLLLAAGADKLVDAAGSREFASAAWATGKLTARHFDTLYHELFNEVDAARNQVFKQLGDWLARLPL